MRTKRLLFITFCGLLFFLFAALGVWQLERRIWKLALIEQVDSRLRAAPVPVPDVTKWRGYDASANDYRRVEAIGVFQNDRETKVDALTERGAGFWLMTPLATGSGEILVNRGFVPTDKASWSRPQGRVIVRGLLRPTEPHGRFLRPNRPSEERWFSRDVAAIARARHLARVAPFFIDADRSGAANEPPIGGMTVVTFRNAHLSYAITWFALALLSAAGLVLLSRDRQKPI